MRKNRKWAPSAIEKALSSSQTNRIEASIWKSPSSYITIPGRKKKGKLLVGGSLKGKEAFLSIPSNSSYMLETAVMPTLATCHAIEKSFCSWSFKAFSYTAVGSFKSREVKRYREIESKDSRYSSMERLYFYMFYKRIQLAGKVSLITQMFSCSIAFNAVLDDLRRPSIQISEGWNFVCVIELSMPKR